ncbi:MAG: AlpA family phage regulatory protein [Methylococcales bacterium]|nr:AlpA family phage regulatory protein [Methylococcales bacterium]
MQQAIHDQQQHQKKRNKVTGIDKTLPIDDDAFIRMTLFAYVLGISRSTFLLWIKQGKIPAGRHLSARCRVWTAGEARQVLAKFKKHVI